MKREQEKADLLNSSFDSSSSECEQHEEESLSKQILHTTDLLDYDSGSGEDLSGVKPKPKKMLQEELLRQALIDCYLMLAQAT